MSEAVEPVETGLTYEDVKKKQGTGEALSPEEVAVVAAHKGHGKKAVTLDDAGIEPTPEVEAEQDEQDLIEALAPDHAPAPVDVAGGVAAEPNTDPAVMDGTFDLSDELGKIFEQVLKDHQETVESMTDEEKVEAKKASVKVLKVPSHLEIPHVPDKWSDAKKQRQIALYLLNGGHGSSSWSEDQKIERMLLAHEYVVKAIAVQLTKLDPDSTAVKDWFSGKAKAAKKAALKANKKAAKKAAKVDKPAPATVDLSDEVFLADSEESDES